jgi:hypothetical protein
MWFLQQQGGTRPLAASEATKETELECCSSVWPPSEGRRMECECPTLEASMLLDEA